MIADVLAGALMVAGLVFFAAGTAGLLRFPDVFARLHALTKADNLGLGLVVLGLALRADSWLSVARLGLIWLLVLAASAIACHLVAQYAREHPDDVT
jgi:multicomponent Na+:H+ antiporter subunit G